MKKQIRSKFGVLAFSSFAAMALWATPVNATGCGRAWTDLCFGLQWSASWSCPFSYDCCSDFDDEHDPCHVNLITGCCPIQPGGGGGHP